MAQTVVVTYGTGATLKVGAQKVSSSGLGYVWNFNTSAWVSSGTYAATTSAMSESGTSGVYSAVLPTLDSTYSGSVLVKVYDNATEAVIWADTFDVINGNPGVSVLSPVVVSRARTFLMQDSYEGAKAANVISTPTDKTLTIAWDFGRVLNPRTGIASVSVTTVSGTGVTISNARLGQDRQTVHADITKSATGNATLRATVTTTDAQEISGDGIITAA